MLSVRLRCRICSDPRPRAAGRAGPARPAGRAQKNLAGPKKFSPASRKKKILAVLKTFWGHPKQILAALISEFFSGTSICTADCWYKICTMFLVPLRAISVSHTPRNERLQWASPMGGHSSTERLRPERLRTKRLSHATQRASPMGGHSTTARGQARQYKTRRVQTSVLPRRSSTTIYNSPHMRACLEASIQEIQQNEGASMMGAARMARHITLSISSTASR